MSNQTIDLRKNRVQPPEKAEKPYEPASKPDKYVTRPPEEKNEGRNEEKNAVSEPEGIIKWKFREYEQRRLNSYWYLYPGILGLALIIFGIFAKSYFFILLVILAFAIWVMYAKKSPPEFSAILTEKGIKVNSKLYELKSMKSFWVIEKEGQKKLILETSSLTQPILHLPLGEINPEEIKEFLKNFLPEKEHKETLIDLISQRLGF